MGSREGHDARIEEESATGESGIVAPNIGRIHFVLAGLRADSTASLQPNGNGAGLVRDPPRFCFVRCAGLGRRQPYLTCFEMCLFISNIVTFLAPKIFSSLSSARISRLFSGFWRLFFLM